MAGLNQFIDNLSKSADISSLLKRSILSIRSGTYCTSVSDGFRATVTHLLPDSLSLCPIVWTVSVWNRITCCFLAWVTIACDPSNHSTQGNSQRFEQDTFEMACPSVCSDSYCKSAIIGSRVAVTHLRQVLVCSWNNFHSCLDPLSSKWHNGQRRVAVNCPQNSQHASHKPFVVGWLTRAHLQQRARTRFWTRAHHTSPQGCA